MTEEVEFRAANTLLERGVRVRITAPLLFKIFGKRFVSLTIPNPTYGTLARMAGHYLSAGIEAEQLKSITAEDALRICADHSKPISKAVACGLINGYFTGWLFTKPFAWYLREKLSAQRMLTIVRLFVVYGGVEDFMTITGLVRDLKITTPNTGQKKQGS